MKPITAVLTNPGPATVDALAATGLVHAMFELVPGAVVGAPQAGAAARPGVTAIPAEDPGAGAVVAGLFERAETPVLLEVHGDFDPHPTAIARLVATVTAAGAGMAYGDWVDATAAGPAPHPVADYQRGSFEDAFPFGPIRAWSVATARKALAAVPIAGLAHHGWYALRLELAEHAPIVHLPEPLGTATPLDTRASGQRVFDYLTATRARQIEAEAVVTRHLDRLGALVKGPFRSFAPTGTFPVVASVVIPVKNRVKTVIDAVDSALSQQTSFPFNVIVVDNHSTDGTTLALRERASADRRLVHVTPDRQDLGIGGCWNVAVNHPQAGKYVVQLDSDDLYSGPDTLARMVAALVEGDCGLAVGSYTLVNMKLEPIPPGLIDHKEWTDDNGPNNALRIGGLGAPRAYATELLRQNPFPNASYGEDYCAVLRVCREYKVGRVYDSLYLCRRWEDNSDADLNHATKARFQTYKDRIRTLELAARIRGNRR
ncbi:MAG: glycosyltransferase family A protein [Myxococcota bacterium]